MKSKIISFRKFIGLYGFTSKLYQDSKYVYLIDSNTGKEIVKTERIK